MGDNQKRKHAFQNIFVTKLCIQLNILLKKNEKTDGKILEVYSDIAMPLLSDYKFFQGLEGGNLNYVSNVLNIFYSKRTNKKKKIKIYIYV